MDNSVTSSTNHSFGNVGEDSFHSVLYGSCGGEMVANATAPLFESVQSNSKNEMDSCKCISNEETNSRGRVESDSEYNLVQLEEESVKKDEEDDEDEDGHWKVISAQQAECPVIHSMTLNQDKSCVAICTDQGYRIRSIPHSNETEQPVMIHTSPYQGQHGGLSICQMLYSTSLLAVVATNSPRTLILLNAKTDTALCQFNFTSSVQNFELNRKLMLVLTSDGQLTSFDLSTSALKLLSSETILNSKDIIRVRSFARFAFFDLSQHEEDAMSYYCISTSSLQHEVGYVLVRNAYDLHILNRVQAHTHSISRMIIGGLAHCQLFATASSKGTMIHIFQLPSCEKKYNLYRGSASCQIYNMAFTDTANCIAISGSSGTIHIYNLTTTVSSSYLPPTKVVTTKIWNFARSFRTQATNAIATTTTSTPENHIEPLRSFAKIKLKLEYQDANIISIFPIATKSDQQQHHQHKKEYIILVITMDGKMLHYLIDECGKQVRLINADELLFDGLVNS